MIILSSISKGTDTWALTSALPVFCPFHRSALDHHSQLAVRETAGGARTNAIKCNGVSNPARNP